MGSERFVWVAQESRGSIGVVKIAVTTSGPKKIGLLERHEAFRFRQQIDRVKAIFTREAALARLEHNLRDELEMIAVRQCEIERAIAAVTKERTPAGQSSAT